VALRGELCTRHPPTSLTRATGGDTRLNELALQPALLQEKVEQPFTHVGLHTVNAVKESSRSIRQTQLTPRHNYTVHRTPNNPHSFDSHVTSRWRVRSWYINTEAHGPLSDRTKALRRSSARDHSLRANPKHECMCYCQVVVLDERRDYPLAKKFRDRTPASERVKAARGKSEFTSFGR
jgi:hypothetical protein